MITLSACMIVRDEEDLFAGCLESIKDCVDEIVVVDTGSVDKTKEIAKSFGAKVYDQPWEGDFSKHRNYSMSLATGDWLLVIDADERIHSEDISLVKQMLEDCGDADCISAEISNLYGEGKQQTNFHSMRFFKRKAKIQYDGIVHNRSIILDGMVRKRSRIRVLHYGYDLSLEKMEKKFKRTKSLLDKQLEKTPNDPFVLQNYAWIHRTRGHHFTKKHTQEIMKASYRAAMLTDPKNQPGWPIHVMSLDLLAWAFLFEAAYDQSIKYATMALSYKSDYLDPMLCLGYAYTGKGDTQESVGWFNRYLAAQQQYDFHNDIDGVIINFIDKRDAAYDGIKVAYGQLKEKGSAYYDAIFKHPYSTKRYDKIYKVIVDWVGESSSILEIGCGTGELAKRLIDAGANYRGIDFSEEAIKIAQSKVGEKVEVGNVYDPVQYTDHNHTYDTIIATEVLEHVNDVKAILNIPSGKRLIASVPNFDDPAHLRTYDSAEEIKNRFKGMLDINRIEEFAMSDKGKIFLFEAIKK